MPEKNNPVAFCQEGIATFPDRLTELIGEESLRSFGRMIGVSEGGLRKYLPPGTSKPTFDKLVAIARYKNVCLEWLATGEGPKDPWPESFWFGDDKPAKTKPTISKVQHQDSQCDNGGTYIEAYGEFILGSKSIRREPVNRQWLSRRGFSTEHLRVAVAQGDSMDPTIKDDDSLVINLNSTTLIDGKVFALNLGGELCARRIQRLWAGGIELIPDNKRYGKQVVPAEDLERLEVVGQVVRIEKDIS